MKELPIIEGIARTAGGSRIQVVAINIEGLGTYRKIAKKLSEMKMLVASDTKREAQRTYDVDEVVDDLNHALAQSLPPAQQPPGQSAATSG